MQMGNKPSNPQPANDSTNVRMGWKRLDTDESVYYDIYFGTSPNPPFLGDRTLSSNSNKNNI